MQSALISVMVSIALATWLPDAARAMRQSMEGVSTELHEATGGSPFVLARDGGN